MTASEDAVDPPALLLHLPDKGKTVESSTAHIDSYCSLIIQQGYAWLGKPGGPFGPDIQIEIEQAIKSPDGMCLYLFVRQSLDARAAIVFRGRIVDSQGPGTNPDRDHLLPEMAKRSCSAWLKVTELQRSPDEVADRLQDISSGLPPSIWTNFRKDTYLVREGTPAAVVPTVRSAWLLCLAQARVKAEFDRNWRFRPVATYQPGSPEFISACTVGPAPAVLVYDRVLGSPTRFRVVGLYEAESLNPQGTDAGALTYSLQLREILRFDTPPTLDSHGRDELWDSLSVGRSEWEALSKGERPFIAVPRDAYARILEAAGAKVTAEAHFILVAVPGSKIEHQKVLHGRQMDQSQFVQAFAQLEDLMSAQAEGLNEAQCYQLLRALENAIRQFIDEELSRVSTDWWAEGRIPQDNKIRAEERRQKRENPFPWLEQQGLSTRDYLDFADYAEVITMPRNWNEVFQQIFIQSEVIRGKLTELGIFRNDIAHMRPLQPGDKAVFVAYAWQLMRMIRRREDIA